MERTRSLDGRVTDLGRSGSCQEQRKQQTDPVSRPARMPATAPESSGPRPEGARGRSGSDRAAHRVRIAGAPRGSPRRSPAQRSADGRSDLSSRSPGGQGRPRKGRDQSPGSGRGWVGWRGRAFGPPNRLGGRYNASRSGVLSGAPRGEEFRADDPDSAALSGPHRGRAPGRGRGRHVARVPGGHRGQAPGLRPGSSSTARANS